MLGRDHLLMGAASYEAVIGPGSLITGVTPTPEAIIIGGVIAAFAGLIPDVDQPGAMVTRGWLPGGKSNFLIMLVAKIISLPFRILAPILHGVLGHRGGTHSIAFTLLWTMLTAIPVLILHGPLWIILAMFMGYFVGHLCMDMITITGIPLLWPITDKHYRVPLFFGYIHTGHQKETVFRFIVIWPILIASVAIAVLLIQQVQQISQVHF